MLKRFLSGLSLTVLFSMLLPMSTFAAEVARDYVQGINLAVNGSAATSFSPADGETLAVNITLNTSQYQADLNQSSGEVMVKYNGQVIKTLDQWKPGTGLPSSLSWDGKEINAGTYPASVCGSAGLSCPDGDYEIEVYVKYVASSTTTYLDTETKAFSIGEDPLNLSTFSLSTTSLDPSPLGADDVLSINYTLNKKADSVTAEVLNPHGTLYKTFLATTQAELTSGIFNWSGIYANKLVEPGEYSVKLTAKLAGESDLIETKTFNVAYSNSNSPDVTNFTVLPDSFDPDFEDAVIEFKNTTDSRLTVEIRQNDGTRVRSFDGYEYDSYSANDTHSVAWDGKDKSGNKVTLTTYKVSVIASSDYGVALEEKSVTVDNSGGSVTTSNAHIEGVSLSPSGTFEPAEDDELSIEFDVKKDLDNLTIFAEKGSTKIEIYDENNVDEENNIEVLWDGTDDDGDYVEPGSWRILFESKLGATVLTAVKSINISYEKPEIDDLYLSKDKFDPDQNEFTNILFRVNADANITIEVLEDQDSDDTLIEDMEVEADKWYAVEWDGGNYDYGDNIDLKLTAENPVMEDVYDTDTIDVDLAEDDVSSNKSNVTGDYISPVITDGESEMRIFYNLEDDADFVEVSIHKGTSGSGSTVINLAEINDQSEGDHTILWDGRNSSGSKLSKGIYTYKIVSKLSSSDTEIGLFVVGEVGDIESVASSSSSSSSDGNISSNVVVLDGNIVGTSGTTGTTSSGNCAGFADISESSAYCDAVTWAKSENIFVGYSDGTFKPYQPINRVEALKVILEALNITILPLDYSSLGFSDVDMYAWYMPYIRTGKFLGIFQGDAGKTTARPDETVNRVEELKLVFETLRTVGSYQSAACGVTMYGDIPVGAWYYNYACASNQYSLFEGAFLNPAFLSTRGEVAEILYKLHNAGLL
ncbi:MAG: FlgD immunoglobulin-like domain containing protein [Candidatus Peregrinibacteria bacterium]